MGTVFPSGYMYMRVPPILSEHSTTMSRPVQMVGTLATPFDPVLTPTLVAPTSPRCQQVRFRRAAQPSKEAVQTPIGSPLDLDSQVQGQSLVYMPIVSPSIFSGALCTPMPLPIILVEWGKRQE